MPPEKVWAWEDTLEANRRRYKTAYGRLWLRWSPADRFEFESRLRNIVGDPISMFDMMVLVSMFNRELKGRESHDEES